MSYAFRQGDLPKLDLQVDRGTDFKAWKSQWEAYLSLSGLGAQAPAKQVQALTLCFSRETVTIVDNLGLTERQRGSVPEIVAAIQRHVEGHINESVERRTFRRRHQQPGETFDDFLVSLRELAKTCKFCSDSCTQKNIRDQIIEGLLDGDAVEHLLKEKDLTLDTAISTCRAQEAAKKQRAEMGHEPLQIQTVLGPPRPTRPLLTKLCPGCGSGPHQGGRQHCPAYNSTCHNCKKIGHYARVCRGRQQPPPTPDTPTPNPPATRAISATPFMATTKLLNPLSFEPAPTIELRMSSLNGQATVQALPDSGADICVAGTALLQQLNEHPDNLLPSTITPRAVNGASMHPIGRLPVTLSLGPQTHTDDFHIYPNVTGTLLSWTAAKGLTILPEHYPQPSHTVTQCLTVAHTTHPIPTSDIRSEFPSVFDGNIKTMDGELFHITLTDDAQPFCVRTPRTVPFSFRDKLKAELELLQEQNIIAPVTEPTEWCAPIVVTPKKVPTTSGCASIYPA